MALAKYNTKEVSNKGRAVEIISPQGTRTGVRFYLLGTDSDEYDRIIRKQQNAQVQKQKKTRGIYIATPEEREENALELLVGLTTGWDEDVVDGNGNVIGVRDEIELEEGQLVSFSPEAALAIYKDRGYGFIREQVDIEIGDRKGFLTNALQR